MTKQWHSFCSIDQHQAQRINQASKFNLMLFIRERIQQNVDSVGYGKHAVRVSIYTCW